MPEADPIVTLIVDTAAKLAATAKTVAIVDNPFAQFDAAMALIEARKPLVFEKLTPSDPDAVELRGLADKLIGPIEGAMLFVDKLISVAQKYVPVLLG